MSTRPCSECRHYQPPAECGADESLVDPNSRDDCPRFDAKPEFESEAARLARRVATLERRLARVLVQGERIRWWSFGQNPRGAWSGKRRPS